MQQDILKKAIERVRKESSKYYDIGMITGSGFGEIIEFQELDFQLPYEEIPKFPRSTVKGHPGILKGGSLWGKNVLLLNGRFHLYEGYEAKDIAFPIRVLRELGVRYLFITSASGGLNLDLRPGDLVLIRDHINMTGRNPLLGENIDSIGPRFPDMTKAYDNDLINLAKSVAQDLLITVNTGIYVCVLGPSLETPAETRFFRMIGGDVIGMSTVPEVIAAVHCGMKVIAIALICNVNNPEAMSEISFAEVLKVAGESTPKINRLWTEIIRRISLNE